MSHKNQTRGWDLPSSLFLHTESISATCSTDDATSDAMPVTRVAMRPPGTLQGAENFSPKLSHPLRASGTKIEICLLQLLQGPDMYQVAREGWKSGWSLRWNIRQTHWSALKENQILHKMGILAGLFSEGKLVRLWNVRCQRWPGFEGGIGTPAYLLLLPQANFCALTSIFCS
jgi:hypothetical protein